MIKSTQQMGFSEALPDVLQSLLASLPDLPNVVRYYDDFDDKVRSITEYDSLNSCSVFIYGSKVSIYFKLFGEDYDRLAKHLFLHFITEDLSISTVYHLTSSLQHVDRDMLLEILSAEPIGIKPVWAKMLASPWLSRHSFVALKGLLVFLAQRNLCSWTPDYLSFIASTLPLPAQDKYAGVRTGDAFLSADEEAAVVNYLDDAAAAIVKDPDRLGYEPLRNTVLLLCSYQFGMRPGQIASIALRDVRIWEQTGDAPPDVHLTFKMVKQKRESKAYPLTRRVKTDWSPLVVLLHKMAVDKALSGGDRLFGVESANEVSREIIKLASKVVGTHVSANDLRHTAAQRLVDAGASQEEVSEFLGHSDISSCLVYFQTSPSQAELVNKALGLSEIYLRVARIAHDRFISPDELAALKGEQQIAGVPHGIPITGIGGCGIGQPSCPFNPITSCYGCRKFMPVTDIDLHNRVLADMRGVVGFFAESSRGDTHSPAYLQLQRTIANIQRVIAELEGKSDA